MMNKFQPSIGMSKIARKNVPKHQIILDKALEGQFDQTLELFDVYVNSITKVDPNKFRAAEYKTDPTEPSNAGGSPQRGNETGVESSRTHHLNVDGSS